MCETFAEINKPQMTIWRKRIARLITKAINTHPEYVILIVFQCNNGCSNAPQCAYVIRTLSILFYSDPFYLLTVGAEGLLLHLITLNDTQSVGVLWARDLPVAKTSTDTTHNNTQTSIPPAGFEPAIATSELCHTYAFGGTATGNDTARSSCY